MPDDVGRKVPQIKTHRFLITADQIVIVDLTRNKVAELIELSGELKRIAASFRERQRKRSPSPGFTGEGSSTLARSSDRTLSACTLGRGTVLHPLREPWEQAVVPGRSSGKVDSTSVRHADRSKQSVDRGGTLPMAPRGRSGCAR